jgi:imidazolonepropionase-like amidohydrolase
MVRLVAVKSGLLLDGTGRDPLKDGVVIIEDSKITEVGEKLPMPQGAEIIDASNELVMPGLIDGHIHLDSDPGLTVFERLFAPDSRVNLRAAKNARLTLEAGFTSILGNNGYRNYADIFLRESIENGWIPGPRLYTSGPSITSTLRNGLYTKYGFSCYPLEQFSVADGVEELRKLVRKHVVSGVDWIKVLATYDLSSASGEPALVAMNREELQVVAQEAHAQDRKVKVHLEGEQTTKEALDVGIDIVLHGFCLDDDDVELMQKKKIALIPTLAWVGEVIRTGAPGMPEWYCKRAKRYNPNQIASFKRAHQAGAVIAAGTDCSGGGTIGDFFRHGENTKELEYLVRNGFTPMEAIVAGTRNVAEAFGLSHLIGTIEPGKLADVIVVDGDPLKDITILQDKTRIKTVIKNGDVVVENGSSKAIACSSLQPRYT